MSDRMTGMSFDQLMNWVTEELENHGTLFGLHRAYKAPEETLTIFGRDLETPIGPAAGPNSQLAQNIAASYYAGSRFFELKTVQIMDGDELAACVNKPCIKGMMKLTTVSGLPSFMFLRHRMNTLRHGSCFPLWQRNTALAVWMVSSLISVLVMIWRVSSLRKSTHSLKV